jgi:hypothetical protein
MNNNELQRCRKEHNHTKQDNAKTAKSTKQHIKPQRTQKAQRIFILFYSVFSVLKARRKGALCGYNLFSESSVKVVTKCKMCVMIVLTSQYCFEAFA